MLTLGSVLRSSEVVQGFSGLDFYLLWAGIQSEKSTNGYHKSYCWRKAFPSPQSNGLQAPISWHTTQQEQFFWEAFDKMPLVKGFSWLTKVSACVQDADFSDASYCVAVKMLQLSSVCHFRTSCGYTFWHWVSLSFLTLYNVRKYQCLFQDFRNSSVLQHYF